MAKESDKTEEPKHVTINAPKGSGKTSLLWNLWRKDLEPSESQSTTYFILDSLDRLSKAKQADVQEVAASQIQLLSVYHKLVLDQARRSFIWALVAAGIGLLFFIASVSFVLVQQSQSAAVISLISGALVEFISAINFYLYSKTSAQLADFQNRLEKIQRLLLANSVCEGLDGEYKQKARSDLVFAIAGIISTPQAKASQSKIE